jgi:hypothetical protein
MIGAEGFPTRRNSLSDLTALADKGEGGVASGGKELKIPTRISQAQHGLKRDLGMVRDFAVYIERTSLFLVLSVLVRVLNAVI